MSNSALSEIYFIIAMMVLSLAISIAAFYFFIKTFYKEKAKSEKIKKIDEKQSESSE